MRKVYITDKTKSLPNRDKTKSLHTVWDEKINFVVYEIDNFVVYEIDNYLLCSLVETTDGLSVV